MDKAVTLSVILMLVGRVTRGYTVVRLEVADVPVGGGGWWRGQVVVAAW